MSATFAWNELATTDVEAAKAFYAAVLGWTFDRFPLPEGEYWVAKSGGQMVCGLGDIAAGSIPGETRPYWFAFLAVDDTDAAVARARANGGSILVEPSDVPNVGRVAVIRDCNGASIGVITGV